MYHLNRFYNVCICVCMCMGMYNGAAYASGADAHATLNESVGVLHKSVTDMRDACVGISDDLKHLQALAGGAAGVSGAGVVAGGVALGTGIAKSAADRDAMKKDTELYHAQWEKLKKDAPDVEFDNEHAPDVDLITCFIDELTPSSTKWAGVSDEDLQKLRQATDEAQRGKKLGDVRTATTGVAALTNAVGAGLAATNLSDYKSGLSGRIAKCLDAGVSVKRALMQAQMDKDAFVKANKADELATYTANGVLSDQYVSDVNAAVRACEALADIDFSKNTRRASGAVASGVIGAATGVAGMVTSMSANSKTNYLSGSNKEKGLNTASNVLAGTTAATGVAGAVFNATQISELKRALSVADACKGALNFK